MADEGRKHSGLGAAVLLGVAFSGFFDGILLHQVLQWHHLLSLAPGAPDDLGFQVMADGAFHILMYVLALVALAWLWAQRQGLQAPGAGRRLIGGAIAGFGAWNVLDVGLFHWILRIHHVRLDTPDWLAWDVLWFVALGLAPAAVGLLVVKRPGRGGGRGAALLLALGVCGAALWAAAPPPQTDRVLVVFAPGTAPDRMMDAVAAVDGLLVETSANAMVVQLPAPRHAWRLYGQGALMVSTAGPAGCLAWTRTKS